VLSFGDVFLVINIPVSEVPEGLINLPVIRRFQELFSSSCNSIAFIPGVFSGIFRIF